MAQVQNKWCRKAEKIYLFFSMNNTMASSDLAQETNKILDEGLKLYVDEYPSLAIVTIIIVI